MGTYGEEVLFSAGALKVARSAQARLFSAKNFKAKNVACVVADEGCQSQSKSGPDLGVKRGHCV